MTIELQQLAAENERMLLSVFVLPVACEAFRKQFTCDQAEFIALRNNDFFRLNEYQARIVCRHMPEGRSWIRKAIDSLKGTPGEHGSASLYLYRSDELKPDTIKLRKPEPKIKKGH